MLQVPTFVFSSKISGLGLFARNHIPKGTTIWKYDATVDWRVPLETVAQMSMDQREFFDKYTYQPFRRDEFGNMLCLPFVEVCGDFAMFMNHSDTPNCNDPEPEITVVIRDIQPGEEITCDYRKIESRPMAFLESKHAHGVPLDRLCLHVSGDLVK
jgi:uncharacterized protein